MPHIEHPATDAQIKQHEQAVTDSLTSRLTELEKRVSALETK
jgi:hypothetical protein